MVELTMTASDELFDLTGRVAVVTGAAGHLGQQMCRSLLSYGATVYLVGRTAESLHEAVSRFEAQGYSARAAVLDVCDPAQVSDFVAGLKGERVDIVVNNAYHGSSGSIQSATDDAYRQSFEITVVAAQRLVKLLLPNLRVAAGDGGASVINVCSMYGIVSPDLRAYDTERVANPPFYGAAKSALLQWTRYAACQFGRENIRFNSISPGPFPVDPATPEERAFHERLADRVPLGRIGKPDEIRGAVVFLASSASSFVNGSDLRVDGGWTAW